MSRTDWRIDFELVKPLFDPIQDENEISARAQEAGAINAGIDLVRRRWDGLLCIKKAVDKLDAETKWADREADLTFQQLDHPFVNACVDVGHEIRMSKNGGQQSFVVLFFEYCDLGALDSVIRRSVVAKRKKLPEPFLWHIFKSMSKALAYIHYGINEFKGQGCQRNWDYIIHRDIKPGNIFLASTKNGLYPRIVLGDFGCATSRSELARSDRSARVAERYTPANAPPEFTSSRQQRFDCKGDVWSLAMAMLDTMGVRDSPQGVVKDPPLRDCGYTKEFIYCLEKARERDYRERPSAARLVKIICIKEKEAIQRGALKNAEHLPEWLFTDGVSESNTDGR